MIIRLVDENSMKGVKARSNYSLMQHFAEAQTHQMDPRNEPGCYSPPAHGMSRW